MSIRFSVCLIFLAWGLSLLVEAQECPTFSLPDNTRWLDADADVNDQGNTFKCAEGYRTMAQSSCLNGEWNISPACKDVDPCRNNPCLNGGTCVSGACTCPAGYYGKTCKRCDVRGYAYLKYQGISISRDQTNDKEECELKCSQITDCEVSGFQTRGGICYLYRFPMVQLITDTTIDKCIQACYDNTKCTGFNFGLSLCEMYNTTAGIPYTLDFTLDYSTSVGPCDDLFSESR